MTKECNDNIKKCALIIPYFGRIPDYFHIWLKSAQANPEFTFLVYTDLPINTDSTSNVIIKHVSFSWVQDLIHKKLGDHCVVNRPYKLCDYRPAYGMLFENDLEQYDFWGFCDVDVVLGNISNFVTQELLSEYDMILSHGSFSLIKNSEYMNTLFLKKYDGVLDFDYACRTRYSSHFDENGTTVYSPEYDNVKLYSPYFYCETYWNSYRLMYENTELCAIWDNGSLMQYWDNGTKSKEIMYIHLQKRKMKNIPSEFGDKLTIVRNSFIDDNFDAKKILAAPIDAAEEKEFYLNRKKSRKKEIINNIKNGALKFRLYDRINKWKKR